MVSVNQHHRNPSRGNLRRPHGGKGTAPGCAHSVRAQRYQADDLKEALRTDDDTLAWQAWHVAHDLIWECCRPGPPLVFPGETELTRAMYDQIGKEEQVISPPYTRTPLDGDGRKGSRWRTIP